MKHRNRLLLIFCLLFSMMISTHAYGDAASQTNVSNVEIVPVENDVTDFFFSSSETLSSPTPQAVELVIIEPTAEPTQEPTAVPAEPTLEPTTIPTEIPTEIPTIVPTAEPIIEPTIAPTTETTAAESSSSNSPLSFATKRKETTERVRPVITYDSVNKLTFEDFGYSIDETFQGVLVERYFTLQLPASWVVQQDAYITLYFTHSLALHHNSSMVVDWNGQRVASVMLRSENASNGELKITIPADRITRGYNNIRVEMYMGISDEFCYDYDNPALWASVGKNSYIEIVPTVDYSIYDLSDVPSLIFDTSPLANNEINLIIPDEPENNSLRALAVAGTSLGRLADWHDYNMKVYTIAEAIASNVQGNVIVAAGRSQAETYFPSLTASLPGRNSGGTTADPTDGLIALGISPYDSRSVALLVTGDTNEGFEKSATALASEEMFAQASGTWAGIRNLPKVKNSSIADSKVITFEAMGYTDQTARGTSEQRITYSLPLEALWYTNNEATLEVHFSHSELLYKNRSTLSVQVNSVAVGSIELNEANASNAVHTFRIPLRFFQQGINTITFIATLEYEDSIYDFRDYCTDDTYLRSWLTVFSNSRLIYPNLPTETRANIMYFPYIFVPSEKYDQFAFVMENNCTSNDAKAMTTLGYNIGKAIPGNPGDVSVIFAYDLATKKKDYKSLVYIGETDSDFIAEINELLPSPFDEATGDLKETSGVISMLTESGTPGYIQAFADTTGGNSLLLASASETGVTFASDCMNDDEIQRSLNGNIAVSTSSERASAYWAEGGIQQSGAFDIVGTTEEQTESSLLFGKPTWVIFAALAVAIIALVILAIGFANTNDKKK